MAEPADERYRSAPQQPSWRHRFGSPALQGDWDHLRRLLLTVVVLGLAYFLWRISGILLLLFAAVLLAVLLRAFAELIARHTPVAENWSLTVAIIVVAALVMAFLFMFGSQILGQISQVFEKLPDAIDAVGNRIGINNAREELEKAVSSSAGPSVLSRAAGLGYTVVGILADLALVVIAAIYLAADPRLYRRGTAKLLPPSQHARIFDAMDVTGSALRLWFAGQLVTMALVGLASGLAYWWIGLPSPLALATIAAVTNFVPFLGPILGAFRPFSLRSRWICRRCCGPLVPLWRSSRSRGMSSRRLFRSGPWRCRQSWCCSRLAYSGFSSACSASFSRCRWRWPSLFSSKKLWVRQTLGEETNVPGEEAPTDDVVQKTT